MVFSTRGIVTESSSQGHDFVGREEGKGSGMTLKGKENVTLEHDASLIQPDAGDTPAHHAPSHEEIRGRAYEIYLERDGLPGDELDDWLRAERELHKVALFKQNWNRLQQRRHPGPEDGN